MTEETKKRLAVLDTIEDRILLRLHDRISLFQGSIGDQEQILGDMTERLMLDLLDPELSDVERDRRAQKTEMLPAEAIGSTAAFVQHWRLGGPWIQS